MVQNGACGGSQRRMSRIARCFTYTSGQDSDGHMQVKSRPLPTYIVIAPAAKVPRRALKDARRRLLAARGFVKASRGLCIDSTAVKRPHSYYKAHMRRCPATCGTSQSLRQMQAGRVV